MLIYLRLKIQSHYMRHAEVKLVQGCSWVNVLQNLEKNHQRHLLYIGVQLTYKSMYPVSKEFLALLPKTSDQNLLHSISQHECTGLEGSL